MYLFVECPTCKQTVTFHHDGEDERCLFYTCANCHIEFITIPITDSICGDCFRRLECMGTPTTYANS